MLYTAKRAEDASATPDDRARREGHLPFGLALTCIVLVALSLRPGIVSIGPILPDMIEAFDLTHTQASLLTAIPTLLMGLLALTTPWLTRRLGRDRVIIAALAVLALSTAARAFSNSVMTLFATTAGVGAGIVIAGTLVPGFVKASFPGRVAKLMGIYALALSVGSAMAAATTGLLLQQFGSWRVPAGLFALPALVGAFAWLKVERRTRMPLGSAPARNRHALPFDNPTAWLIGGFFALNNFVFYSYVSWLAPIYVEFGWSPASAGLILACFTVAFMVGAPLFGAASGHEDRRRWLATSSGISAAGVLWLTIAPTAAPFAAVSLIAFGTGGAFTLGMTLPLDNARSDGETIAWNAFVMLLSYVVGAGGPVLTGVLRDTTGSFDAPMWVLVAVSAAMLSLTAFLQPYHHRLAAAARARGAPVNQGESA